jgi:hypothetical protein
MEEEPARELRQEIPDLLLEQADDAISVAWLVSWLAWG